MFTVEKTNKDKSHLSYNLTMKTVLITGASSGFGKACAELLAKKGYRLVLTARRKRLLEKMKTTLNTDMWVSPTDIRSKMQVDQMFKNLPQKYRDIDILLNNAGLALGLETADNAKITDWEEMVNTNIKGLLYMTHKILPGMKKRNKGIIINIGSVAATMPYRGGNVYGASKAFVRQFSNNLRTDLLGTDIKVTNIEPGAAETEFSIIRFKGDKNKAKKVYENMRALKPEDIARAVLWVIEQPERVNINHLEMSSIDQAHGGISTYRHN